MAVRLPDYDPLEGHIRYRKLEVLGAGASGFVFKALDTETMELVAIKFLDRSEGFIPDDNKREVLNHFRLNHTNVVKFREVFLTTKHLAIVMDFAAGGNWYLVKETSGISEADAAYFFKQLIFGLDYCHKSGISNRDIKLTNMLLHLREGCRPVLKICDFGFSINGRQSQPNSGDVGTLSFCAPEILRSKANPCLYNAELVDVWSSGVVLYNMIFWRYPFQRAEDRHLSVDERNRAEARRIIEEDYDQPKDTHVSKECMDLLSKIFKEDPQKRISIADIWRDPWVQLAEPRNLDLKANDDLASLPLDYDKEEEIRALLNEADEDEVVDVGNDNAEI